MSNVTNRANTFLDSIDDFYGNVITEAKKEEKKEEVKTDLNRKRDDLYKKISSFEKLAGCLEKVRNCADDLEKEICEYEAVMVGNTDCCGMLKNIGADAAEGIAKIERAKLKLEQLKDMAEKVSKKKEK